MQYRTRSIGATMRRFNVLLIPVLISSCAKAEPPPVWTIDYYSRGAANGSVDYSSACETRIGYLVSIGGDYVVIRPLPPDSHPGWSTGEELSGPLPAGAAVPVHDVSTGRNYRVQVIYITRDHDTAVSRTDAECQ